MAAYSELQQKEFTREKDGYTGESTGRLSAGSQRATRGWPGLSAARRAVGRFMLLAFTQLAAVPPAGCSRAEWSCVMHIELLHRNAGCPATRRRRSPPPLTARRHRPFPAPAEPSLLCLGP